MVFYPHKSTHVLNRNCKDEFADVLLKTVAMENSPKVLLSYKPQNPKSCVFKNATLLVYM